MTELDQPVAEKTSLAASKQTLPLWMKLPLMIYGWSCLSVFTMDLSSKKLYFEAGGHWFLVFTMGLPVSGLLVAILLVGLGGALGSLRAAALLVFTLGATIGAVNLLKLEYRREPVSMDDLSWLKDPQLILTSIPLAAALVPVLGLAGAAWLIWRGLSRLKSSENIPSLFRDRDPRRNISTRIGAAFLSVLLLWPTLNYYSDSNWIRSAYERSGMKAETWDRFLNFAINGVIPSLLLESSIEPMEKPSGYSEEALQLLLVEYQAETLPAVEKEQPNVLLVLSESLTDFSHLDTVEMKEDPISFTNSLIAAGQGGKLLTHKYGGGTGDVEFEAVTGQSMLNFNPLLQLPYKTAVEKGYPSYFDSYKTRGYQTLAVHPYRGSGYGREEAYRNFGVDTVLFADDLPEREPLEDSRYMGDEDLFDLVLEELHASEKPIFGNIVTMQNHAGYEDIYDNPLPVEVAGEKDETMGNYAYGLSRSDAALKALLTELEKSSEPTVVVLYGDHWPGVFPDEIKEAATAVESQTVPYVVWSNFTKTVAPHQLINAHQLPAIATAAAGLSETPMDALLRQLREEMPAMLKQKLVAPDGKTMGRESLTERQLELLAAYSYVQYGAVTGSPIAREFYRPVSSPQR